MIYLADLIEERFLDAFLNGQIIPWISAQIESFFNAFPPFIVPLCIIYLTVAIAYFVAGKG